jgi:selenide,water dikinase
LPKLQNPRVLVGTETADDAGVFQISDTMALVQTVDFFTPIVDDPYIFGQIAAANSLSDVYAMGGVPVTALNIVGFPFGTLSADVLADTLKGGQAKAAEAGVAILGGHTIQDKEPKYGLSVTGLISPDAIYTNAQAECGDYLVLTKPIGTGIVTTAEKAGLASPDALAQAIASMITLNAAAAQAMRETICHSCTDITGFGLIGHIYEMAVGSQVSIELFADTVPILPGALEYALMGLIPGGAYANRTASASDVHWDEAVPEVLQDLFYDPQTSGGLLISVPAERLEVLLAKIQTYSSLPYAVIGRVIPSGEKRIIVHSGKGI